jgi:PAS domain S-box-containing protein
MKEAGPLLFCEADEAPPAWLSTLAGLPTRTIEATAPLEDLRSALRGTDCVLVAGGGGDPTDRIRRAHLADPSVQVVVVAPAAEHRRLRRSILFAPGVGEVWFRTPDQVDPELVVRAGDVTRTRRGYRQTESQIRQSFAALEPRVHQRAVVSDAYLATLLEAVPNPVVSLDDAGTVLSWNPGAERVLGYTPSEAVGRPLAEVFVTAHGKPALDDDDFALDTPVRREIEFQRKNGEPGTGELIVSLVETGGQRVRAVILHDLTSERKAQAAIEAQAVELEEQAEELQAQASELEMINEELQAHALALEQATRVRERFYAAMSHELRTPINAVLGFLDLVLTGVYGPLADKQEEGLIRAQRAARHLHELVNDVLDLARIEAGRMDVQVEETPLPAVITEVLETVRGLADQAGSRLAVRGPAFHRIHTDPRRLRQILLNLLSNAVKFGGEGPIEVRWEVTDDDGVWIEVVDQGRGIEPQDLERIFDEFTQAGSHSSGGSGLGLPISRRLAHLLGGSLEAASLPGKGSTFRLVLPNTIPAG